MTAKNFGEGSSQPLDHAQTAHGSLWHMWVLTNLAGGAIATLLLHVAWVAETDPVTIGASAGTLLVPGLALGVLQFLVLRRHLATVKTWIALTVAGWSTGWVSGGVVGFVVAIVVGAEQLVLFDGGSAGAPWSGVIIFGVGGMVAGSVMGGLQWTALRTHVARPVIWIPVNTVAMAVGGVSVGVAMWWVETGYRITDGWGWGWGWSAVIASLLYGAITGFGLMLLLRRSRARAFEGDKGPRREDAEGW